MLRWRLILGALFIAALVGLCWLDFHATRPGVFLLPLAAVLSLAGAGELLAMFRKRGHTPLPWVVYGGALITVLLAGASVYMPADWSNSVTVGRLGWLAVGLATSFAIAVVAELRRYPAQGRATSDLGVSCLAILYIGGLMGFMVQLRLLSGGPWGKDGRWGMLAIASLIATVKMSDTGQYWVGRMFGRHKLAPAVSPGKTWEGAVGGVLFAVGTAWLVFAFSRRSVSAINDVVPITSFAIAVAIAGIVGDLAESMLKRDAGVKDSSAWMPGFGGVLDLLDSLLGAAPVAYIFWALRIVGP
ncbi:MAG TPA: CDP-archaeol synthase [Lacipirellulaceae bacterium]